MTDDGKLPRPPEPPGKFTPFLTDVSIGRQIADTAGRIAFERSQVVRFGRTPTEIRKALAALVES